MTEAVHTEFYRGYKIEVYPDTDPQNPRKEFDHMGKMICFHRRHSLGDDHDYANPQAVIEDLTGKDTDELGQNPNDDLGDGSAYRIVWEPLYLYDHSGITMKTTPFSDRWDSGQVGIIYATYADIMKAFGIEPIKPDQWIPTEETIKNAEKALQAEVSEYDDYLRGNIYGYRVYAPDPEFEGNDEEDDDYWCADEEGSCWGIYGDYDGEGGAVAQAREEIDALIDKG